VTVWWFIKNTGIPIAFSATVVLGFVVGLAISSQTFYSFILENLRNLGALKAMGASDRVLSRMVMLQTLTVGLIGYGCGVGLAMLFGMALLKKGMPPFFLPWPLPLITNSRAAPRPLFRIKHDLRFRWIVHRPKGIE